MNNLQTALELTALGMGMTFLSIGALVLGMYLLTRLLGGKEETPVSEVERDQEIEEPIESRREGERSPSENRRRAAAAAVAVAVAESGAHNAFAQKERYIPDHEAWNSFVRNLHLSGRLHYETRRSQR